MIFGEGLVAPSAAPSTDWIDDACRSSPGTVGALVPNDFEAHLRIWPPPESDDFWEAYAAVHRAVAAAGERHTSTPDLAWFAIWDGHGWVGGTSVAWSTPPADSAEQRARRAEVARLRAENARRAAAVEAALAELPTVDRPHRRYHVVSGPLAAVGDLRAPDERRWQNPDLWWPDDRSWFVATDVDFWSLYVGGSSAFAADLLDTLPAGIRAQPVSLDTPIEDED